MRASPLVEIVSVMDEVGSRPLAELQVLLGALVWGVVTEDQCLSLGRLVDFFGNITHWLILSIVLLSSGSPRTHGHCPAGRECPQQPRRSRLPASIRLSGRRTALLRRKCACLPTKRQGYAHASRAVPYQCRI